MRYKNAGESDRSGRWGVGRGEKKSTWAEGKGLKRERERGK